MDHRRFSPENENIDEINKEQRMWGAKRAVQLQLQRNRKQHKTADGFKQTDRYLCRLHALAETRPHLKYQLFRLIRKREKKEHAADNDAFARKRKSTRKSFTEMYYSFIADW